MLSFSIAAVKRPQRYDTPHTYTHMHSAHTALPLLKYVSITPSPSFLLFEHFQMHLANESMLSLNSKQKFDVCVYLLPRHKFNRHSQNAFSNALYLMFMFHISHFLLPLFFFSSAIVVETMIHFRFAPPIIPYSLTIV